MHLNSRLWARLVLRCGLLTALFLGASVAYAAQEGQSEALSILEALRWLSGRLLSESVLQQFVDKGKELANGMLGPARILAGGLALVSLLWGVLMAFINKKSPLNAVVEAGIFASLSALMIQNFAWVSDGVYKLAKDAMGQSSLPAKAASFLESLVVGFGAILANIFGRIFDIGFLDILQILPAVFAVLLALVFGLLAFVTLLGLALQGPFALGIGLAVAPMIAATIASPYTRRWFDQWLNFMVGAAFSTAMIWIALSLLMAPMEVMINDASNGKHTILAGAAFQIALLMFFASKMLAAVPSISDAIFPGRTGAGSIAASARDFASMKVDIAKMTAATVATAKLLGANAGKAAQAGLNGGSNVSRAMTTGWEAVRGDARSGAVEKVGAAAMRGGESMVNDVGGRVSSATGRAVDAVSRGWQTDEFKGVKLGDRVANALKTASGELKNADIGVGSAMAAGAQAAGGVAMATAGAATKLAGGALDAAGQGVAAGYRTVTRSSAERRKSVREQMMGTSSPTPPPTNSGD